MTEIKVEIPNELKFIRHVSNVDWSLLFNKIVREELEKTAKLKKIILKSELSEKDVEELTEVINKSISSKY